MQIRTSPILKRWAAQAVGLESNKIYNVTSGSPPVEAGRQLCPRDTFILIL